MLSSEAAASEAVMTTPATDFDLPLAQHAFLPAVLVHAFVAAPSDFASIVAAATEVVLASAEAAVFLAQHALFAFLEHFLVSVVWAFIVVIAPTAKKERIKRNFFIRFLLFDFTN